MSAHPKSWLLDLGNSRLKLAPLLASGQRGAVSAIDHGQADAAARLVQELMPIGAGDVAWLASVAKPGRSADLSAALRDAGLVVHPVRSQAACGRLRIAYPDPAQLGVDRFLALLAASERDDGPWLLVSAGSALTVDLLASDGQHLGGLIAPMPAHSRAVLAQNFPQLDLPEGRAGEFADNTADAIASGARAALLGLVERSLRSAHAQLGVLPVALLSGGAADLFDGLDHPRVLRVEAPVLDGLAIYVRHRES
jgi:type III pantothenate kinase